MNILLSLLATKVGRTLAAALTLLLGLLLVFHAGSRRGARLKLEKINEMDRVTADRIRDRVAGVPKRVRPDEIIYRD